MPPIFCDATSTPPLRVFTPSTISMYVGDPPRQLLIFSGVAQPEWDSESELDFADVVVRLGPPTTDNFQFTCTASLASISNTDSDFVFAADQSTVVNQPSGLELHVRIAVKGDSSLFSRFSYHVQVLSDLVVSEITGTIRWNQATLGDPTTAALDGIGNMFRVAAGVWTFDPAGGPFGSSTIKELAHTFTSTPPTLGGGVWAVPYRLKDIALNQQVQVWPTLVSGMKTPPGIPVFIPTPRLVTLTPSNPSAARVDFELVAGEGVH